MNAAKTEPAGASGKPARARSTLTLPAGLTRQWHDSTGQITAWWNQRSARERQLLLACSAVVFVAVGWLAAVEPALKRMQQWETELPRLRSQSTEIETIVRQATAERGSPASTASARTPADTQQAITVSLDAATLQGNYTMAAPDARTPARWEVHFKDAPVRALVPWLLQAPAGLGLAVTSVALERPQVAPATPPGMTWARAADAQPSPPTARSRPATGRLSGTVILAPASQEDKDKS